MKVTLLAEPNKPWKQIWAAYRVCYSANAPEPASITEQAAKSFVLRMLDEHPSHTSPLEHVAWQFLIDDISRACSHQLVRHRVGISFAQQSQRYVKMNEESYVTPKLGLKAEGVYKEAMTSAWRAYRDLLTCGVPAEDARYVLPNACTTRMVVTINLAALLHLGDLRLCERAQWEIRQLVIAIRREISAHHPEIAARIRTVCDVTRTGRCPEGESAQQTCPIAKGRER